MPAAAYHSHVAITSESDSHDVSTNNFMCSFLSIFIDLYQGITFKFFLNSNDFIINSHLGI